MIGQNTLGKKYMIGQSKYHISMHQTALHKIEILRIEA